MLVGDTYTAQDGRSYNVYAEGLFLGDKLKSTRLLSAMSSRQYIDAISAPKLDPTAQGRRVMMSRRWSTDEDSDAESSSADEVQDTGIA